MLRPCLSCGRLSIKTRCLVCTAQRERMRRPSTTARGYGSDWQRQSRDAITDHVATYGQMCPGYSVAPHPSADLTLDHIVDGDASRTQVLCRSCNARKRAMARGAPHRPDLVRPA